jgi:hypothetical protein
VVLSDSWFVDAVEEELLMEERLQCELEGLSVFDEYVLSVLRVLCDEP